MTTVRPTKQPAYWRAEHEKEIVSGITAIGEMTGITSAAVAVSGEGEGAYLDAIGKSAQKIAPIPQAGTELKRGEVYTDGEKTYMVRQSHTRTEHNPANVLALFTVYRPEVGKDDIVEWVAGEKIDIGTQRAYNGKTYRCLQAHVTQFDWTPPTVPALWAEVLVVGSKEWAAGTAYKVKDEVTYSGKTYSCLQAHTAQVGWHPPAVPALWKAI